jgi:hypothetical protein
MTLYPERMVGPHFFGKLTPAVSYITVSCIISVRPDPVSRAGEKFIETAIVLAVRKGARDYESSVLSLHGHSPSQ